MMLVVALLTIVFYILFYLYLEKCFKYWKLKNIPIKKPEYFIGNIIGVLLGKYSSSKYIAKLSCEFESPYFVFFALYKPFLVVKDPNIIKRILVTDFIKFSDKTFFNNKDIDAVFSNSIFSLPNPLWRNVRTRVSKVFSPAKIKAMVMMTKASGEKLKMYLEDGLDKTIDVKDATVRYSTEVISNCVFGIYSNSFTKEPNKFVHYTHNIFPKSYIGTFKGFTYVFLPQIVKIFKYQFFDETSCNFFYEIFTKLFNLRENSNIRKNDLMDILVDIKKEDVGENIFDQKRLLAQAISFLAVGHETLSSIVALTIYQLSLNGDIQTKLREEINEILERYGGDVTSEALDSMNYLQMVIFESLRMYPVIQFIQRKCTEDCLIPETGVTLEKGTSIIIPTHWLHFNETYFSEPYKYNPERFNEENKHLIDPFTFLPFSAGPRGCLGKRFALMNLKISILYFVKHFQIDKDDDTKTPIFGSSHSLEPKNGIFVRFSKI